MQCPIDQTTLVMAERSGIEIDYCPTCRGVWLDRGELDKIIERAAPAAAPAAAAPGSYERERDERRHQQEQRYSQPQQYRKKRKENWLGEIFDF
ncbi:zf-TFIIB domain-containing protein [Nocardioides sp.]|uniref:TFIIB-type zinc ribbon-containing protein n=1 Tax=Nocardioides sp. TaxID=35761 RepID=UPI002ED09C38